jgi:octaprenyl-diphosphate synthase
VSSVHTGDHAAVLGEELAEVEQAVLASLADLHMPFAQLVQRQWRLNHPLVRAAFVLTAAAVDSDAHDAAELHRKRIYLAAAMETLRLALAVHTDLLRTDAAAGVDRSILGSTVLAGDFCFSRSAGLAAKTGSPAIVDLFAQALQRVSEGSLRGLFRPAEPFYDEDRELCLSGIAAAGELAALPAATRVLDQQLGAHLFDVYRALPGDTSSLTTAEFGSLTPARRPYWQALEVWLLAQRST